MFRILTLLLAGCGLLAATGCMSDPVRTGSIRSAPSNDQSTNAPAYPNRPGIRQAGFER